MTTSMRKGEKKKKKQKRAGVLFLPSKGKNEFRFICAGVGPSLENQVSAIQQYFLERVEYTSYK